MCQPATKRIVFISILDLYYVKIKLLAEWKKLFQKEMSDQVMVQNLAAAGCNKL